MSLKLHELNYPFSASQMKQTIARRTCHTEQGHWGALTRYAVQYINFLLFLFPKSMVYCVACSSIAVMARSIPCSKDTGLTRDAVIYPAFPSLG